MHSCLRMKCVSVCVCVQTYICQYQKVCVCVCVWVCVLGGKGLYIYIWCAMACVIWFVCVCMCTCCALHHACFSAPSAWALQQLFFSKLKYSWREVKRQLVEWSMPYFCTWTINALCVQAASTAAALSDGKERPGGQAPAPLVFARYCTHPLWGLGVGGIVSCLLHGCVTITFSHMNSRCSSVELLTCLLCWMYCGFIG